MVLSNCLIKLLLDHLKSHSNWVLSLDKPLTIFLEGENWNTSVVLIYGLHYFSAFNNLPYKKVANLGTLSFSGSLLISPKGPNASATFL